MVIAAAVQSADELDGLSQLAHDLQGVIMRQADRHDRRRPRTDQPRERQPQTRPLLSRGDHHWHPWAPATALQCSVLCFKAANASMCWLVVDEADVLRMP